MALGPEFDQPAGRSFQRFDDAVSRGQDRLFRVLWFAVPPQSVARNLDFQALLASRFFADMALQAEGAEWAVAIGTVDRNIVFSVRNVGYVRAAGEVVRAVVEGLGVGGGHRSMAKGIIPLKAFREVYGSTNKNQIRSALFDAFIRAIHHADD